MLAGKNIRSAGLTSVAVGSVTARQFWLLAAFLFLIFLCGGVASGFALQLVVLRPVAILAAAFALLAMRSEHWRDYRAIWLLLGAATALALLHLVPLPPSIWQSLPGRDIIVDVERVAGLEGGWRPLTMAPDATWNALYAMAVPIAVALLAAQLDRARHAQLLLVILVLALASGVAGVLQATGLPLQFYDEASQMGGLFANRNHQALLLALAIPMSAAWAELNAANPRWARPSRYICIAIIMVLVPLIVLTGSRTGVLLGGLALASLPLFLGGLVPRGFASSGQRGLIAAGWAVFALAVAGILYSVSLSRFTSFDRLSGSEADVRLSIWSSTWDAAGHYLPWGSGIGSFARVYQITEPADLLDPLFTNHAHNEWLEIAVTAGFPGLALLAAAALLYLAAAWQCLSSPVVSKTYNRLGVLAIFLLAIASTADYPVRTPILSAILALAAVWAMPSRVAGHQAGTDSTAGAEEGPI